ncbi:MAG: hypothetical protein H7246_19685 [Phycisphaerae bacterium]|nr:hypothetical protein [Saprospiraceae bacterium]
MKKLLTSSFRITIRTLVLLLGLLSFECQGLTQSLPDSLTFVPQPEASFFKAFFVDLTSGPVYRKEKRAIRKFLRDADDEKLEAYIHRLEVDGEDKEIMLRNFPFVYYVLLNSWYRCANQKHYNKDLAYRYGSIAAEYGRQNTFSEDDAVLVRKVTKFAKKYESVCLPYGKIKKPRELVVFMAEERHKYILEKTTAVKEVGEDSEKIRVKLEPLEKKSLQLAKEIADLEKQLISTKSEIRGLSMQNYEDALKDIDALIKKNEISRGSGNVTLDTTLAGGARFINSSEITSDTISSTIYNTGYKKGVFCSPEIRSATNKIVSTIFKIADFQKKTERVSPDYLKKIQFNVTITGKADGDKVKRRNGVCTLKNNDSSPITGEYYTGGDIEFRNPIKVNIAPGGPICDEELAFLRAHCAYSELKIILPEFGIPASNINPKIIVRVYDEIGPEYRGIDLEFNVDKLFVHLRNEIDKKYAEKQIVDEKIADLRRQLQENAEKITDIKKPWVKEDKIIKEKLEEIKLYKA